MSAGSGPAGGRGGGSVRSGEKRHWIDSPRNVRKIYIGLWIVCGLTATADLLYHKHTHFSWEEVPGFHGAYGFAGCVLLVLTAKVLRLVLMRGENYYDD